jgi:mannose-6-phosphate isomerase-like protein (cupin superfamily)
MNNFQVIAQGVDVMPLLLAIKRRPDLWKEDTYLRDYPQGPFGEIESIMLRFPPRSVFETEEELKKAVVHIDQHENVDQPAYKVLHEARPLVMNLMARVGGERLGRVMINKIMPGGQIFPHADTPEHADYYTRFHLVLWGQPGAILTCDSEQFEMRTGDCFWFNNKLMHSVVNNSAEERISMVIDIRTSR